MVWLPWQKWNLDILVITINSITNMVWYQEHWVTPRFITEIPITFIHQDLEDFMMPDLKITNPTFFKHVIFARNHWGIIETSSCTGLLASLILLLKGCFRPFQLRSAEIGISFCFNQLLSVYRSPSYVNCWIYYCRGDTPFCSEECRQEQIEIDEAKEKNRNLSSSMMALRKKEQRESVSPNKTQDYSFRAGTVAAA